MARVREKNRVGVYGDKTRRLQRSLTYEAFQMTFKTANVYRYLGSRKNDTPDIQDIQNITFFEVPDRAYDQEYVTINIGMEPLQEGKMDFSQFGIISPMSDEIRLRVHVDDFHCLGRELIPGDVIEIPFLEVDCDRAFFEVSDVDKDPSYEKFYVVVTVAPLNDSRKTREIDKDRSNEHLFASVMEQSEEQAQNEVGFEGLDESTVDSEWQQPTSPVDYRRNNQKSFLDDPLYEFTGDNNDD